MSPGDPAKDDRSEPIPKVSVVVPARNAERTLEACLLSVRAQSYPEVELLVVDNGSHDSTLSIGRRHADRVIDGPLNPGIHRNIAVEQATGEFILYVDSDMTLEPELLEECVELCSKNGFGALVIPELSSGENFWGRVRALERNAYVGDPAMESPRFLKRTWFEQIGGFREHLTGFEDMALANDLEADGCPIGRSSRSISHNEGSPTLVSIFRKKRFWGRHLGEYRRSYPDAFRTQAGLRRLWLRNRGQVIRTPGLALSLPILKVVDAIGLLTGYLRTRFISPQSPDQCTVPRRSPQ